MSKRKKHRIQFKDLEKLETVKESFKYYQNNKCINGIGQCTEGVKLYIIYYIGGNNRLVSLCNYCANRHPFAGISYRKVLLKEEKDIFAIKILHQF